MKSNFTPALINGSRDGREGGGGIEGKKLREKMRGKKRKEGRKEEGGTRTLRGRASSILRNSDIALYSANPPSYGPLDRHALPRNHGKTRGGKNGDGDGDGIGRDAVKSRSCLSIRTI